MLLILDDPHGILAEERSSFLSAIAKLTDIPIDADTAGFVPEMVLGDVHRRIANLAALTFLAGYIPDDVALRRVNSYPKPRKTVGWP